MDWTDNYDGRTLCGSEEAEKRTYKKYIGKSGRIWLVACQENEADNIYVSGGKHSQGFGGRTLTFDLEGGGAIELQGPWHSNSVALLKDTGVDVTNKHFTFGVIGQDIRYGSHGLHPVTIINVLHKDEKWTLGEFNRIEKLAQEIANELQLRICYFQKSKGGSSCGPIKPEKAEVSSS